MTDEPTKTYEEAEAGLSGILNTFTLARSTAPTREREGEQHAYILDTVAGRVAAGVLPPQGDITAGEKNIPHRFPSGVDAASYWLKPGVKGLQLDLWVYADLFRLVCPGGGGNFTFSRYLSDPILSRLPYMIPHAALEEVKWAWWERRPEGEGG
ncbi:hypothetical protein V5F44_21115 [Xanthobacter sp. V2C-8]|uniref:hypothetical protein n=1 Tax=Xanthobacter albus TaxID=3119929 RepID=UPI003728465E